MQLAQLSFTPGQGWSAPLPAALDGPDTLLLAFGAVHQPEPQAALQQLAQALPRSLLVGCTGAGLIVGDQVNDDALWVSVAAFDRTTLRRVATELAGAADSRAAGQRLAAQLPTQGLRAVFVLSAGVDVHGAGLVQGLTAGLPDGVVLTGGLAGWGDQFACSWVLDGTQPREAFVTAVGLYGDSVRVGHGCDGGWQDFGPERRITRSQGTQLDQLDGQPALALYKTYLGELATQLPGSALRFPLSLRAPVDGAPAVVRTILAIDDGAQSLTFAGDMPEGHVVRLMRTSVERLVGSADDAAAQAVASLGSGAAPVLALSVSCIGRRLMMGERTEEEVEAVAEQLPPGSVHAGFYSYGEIAPAFGGTQPELHNQTMTLTVITEG